MMKSNKIYIYLYIRLSETNFWKRSLLVDPWKFGVLEKKIREIIFLMFMDYFLYK